MPLANNSPSAAMTALDGSAGSDGTFATCKFAGIDLEGDQIRKRTSGIDPDHPGRHVRHAPFRSSPQRHVDVNGFRPIHDLAAENPHRGIRLIDRVVMRAQFRQCIALASDDIDRFLDRRPGGR